MELLEQHLCSAVYYAVQCGSNLLLTGCGHTIELNRHLASKSRLTSNHDLAENHDLMYFWSNYTEFNRDLSLFKSVNHAKNTDGRHRSLSLYCMPATESYKNVFLFKQILYCSFLHSFA